MIRKAALIGFLSIAVVLALMGTKVLNAPHVIETDATSYSDASAIIYVLCGIALIFIAFWTYKFHFIAGIIPFGIGFSCLFYGILVCFVKFGG